MPDKRLSQEDAKRNAAREALFVNLQRLIVNNFRYVLSLPQVKQALQKTEESYSIFNDKTAIRKLNTYLKANKNQFEITLLNAIQEEWDYAKGRFWNGVKTKYGKTLEQIKIFEEIKVKAETDTRSNVNSARKFFDEVKGGQTISKRIWNIYDQMPSEMDVLIQNAIKEGTPADELARSLEKFLKEPNKIYRRVRNNKTGKLEWSKSAQEHHPGRGKYRSSFKNANRLARTEINRAYRRAEWNGYQNNVLIYGFEIVLSNNTENQCEVCKRLAGVYPKWFCWTGWHPQCRCRMVPILMPKDERKRQLQYRFSGREAEFKPNFITELPNAFKEYLSENKERISNAASVPYWLEDNKERLIDYF